MASYSANFLGQLLASKIHPPKSTTKQPILIDLQSDQDSTLSIQQNKDMIATSNLVKLKNAKKTMESQNSREVLVNETGKLEKGIDMQNVQSNKLPAPSIKNQHLCPFEEQKQQKDVVNQENFVVKAKKQSFSGRLRSYGRKKKLALNQKTQKQRKLKMSASFKNQANELMLVDEAQQQNQKSMQSCQNLGPTSINQVSQRPTLMLKRKTRSDTVKEKSFIQISSSDSLSSTCTDIFLLKNSAYRFKIPSVVQKIGEICQELRQKNVVYFNTAPVKPSPDVMMNSQKHRILKRSMLRQLEKRRVIYVD